MNDDRLEMNQLGMLIYIYIYIYIYIFIYLYIYLFIFFVIYYFKRAVDGTKRLLRQWISMNLDWRFVILMVNWILKNIYKNDRTYIAITLSNKNILKVKRL